MASDRWEYRGYYKNYDMEGDIKIGTGIVKVHDLFNPLPAFMLEADVVFSDPPYNQSALTGFRTKADIKEQQKFDDFVDMFMKRIFEIDPKIIILEVGVPQEPLFKEKLLNGGFSNIIVKDAFYYDKGLCRMIVASREDIPAVLLDMPENIDEEKVIDYICGNLDFSCIADVCMGTGLVGWYANKYGKKFAGTELNKKRLGVLLERITTGQRGSIR